MLNAVTDKAKDFCRCRQRRKKIFSDVGDGGKKF
jgi:hypothetical protein